MTGPRPPGSLASSTSQSPSPVVSSSRGWLAPNQPSSSKKSSAPKSAVWSISCRSRSVSNEKAVASQLLTTIGRSLSPSRTAWARTQRWKRCVRGPMPPVDHIQICSGVTKVVPGSSAYSDDAGLCPHQIRSAGVAVRSKAKRMLPPQASAPARIEPADSSGDPSGASRKNGQDCRWGCTPPRDSTTLVPGVRASVVVVHSDAQSPPPKWVRYGAGLESRGEAAATS